MLVALVKDTVVVNVIEGAPPKDWMPPENCAVVPVPDGVELVGDEVKYLDGSFVTNFEAQFSAYDVSLEAERRIEAGTHINGTQFKTDQASVSRLREMLDGFGAGLPEASQVKACTAEGVLLVLDTQEKVQALYHAAIKYRAGIVTRSAEIQQLDPIPDPSKDPLWDLTKTLPKALAALT